MYHKRTACGYRGCGRIPYAGKLAIIREKFFNIWANHIATFAFKLGSVYFAITTTKALLRLFCHSFLPLMTK